MPRAAKAYSLLRRRSIIVLQQLLHSRHFVLVGLLLVRSGADSDVALDSDNTVFMKHGVTLADDFHDIVP